MTTFGDVVRMLGGVPVGSGLDLVGLNGGRWYFVDPTHGTTGGDGSSPENANSSLLTMYNQLRDGYNDGIIQMAGATAYSPAAAFTWSKSYTHLIGANNGLLGMGSRCRITNTAANDLATLFTLSGSGCLISGIQFYDGKDKDEDGSCLVVSGSRNHLNRCFVAGMGHATPAARAGSLGLTLSGSENLVSDSVIGIDTIVRAAANAELKISGMRNKILHSEIRSYSETSGKFLVALDTTATMYDTQFEDVLFYNFSVNWASGLANAFNVPAGATHFVILRGNCQFVGVGMGVADTVTHVYGAGAAPNAGMFISTNPTT